MLDIWDAPCYYIEALKSAYAPVAQLDRVTDYESVGQGFESLLAYQNGNLRVSVLFLFIGTRTSKCGADERRRRRLDGAAHLFSPIPGRKRKRVPSGVPAPETVRFRELLFLGDFIWDTRRERPACRSHSAARSTGNGTQAVPYDEIFHIPQKSPPFGGDFMVSPSKSRLFC